MSQESIRLIKRFARTKTGPVFAVILIIMVLGAIFAPVLAPHDPNRQYWSNILETPSSRFPLGTDELGRDVFSRLLYGGRITLLVAFTSVGLAVAVGLPLGILSGVVGGRLDVWLMHAVNGLLSFPSILLAFTFSALMGPSVFVVILAVTVVYAPRYTRFARGQTLAIREIGYVEAARAVGISTGRLIFRHIAPNIMAPILVEASIGIATAALIESSISFLGAGIQPPNSSWGLMIKDGFGYIDVAPWVAIIPGVAILLLALCANVLGDVLRDVLDPRARL